jgi:hypothetical protein
MVTANLLIAVIIIGVWLISNNWKASVKIFNRIREKVKK